MGEKAGVLREDNTLYCELKQTDIAVERCRQFQMAGACGCEAGRRARDEYAAQKNEELTTPVEAELCDNRCGRTKMAGKKHGLCRTCWEEKIRSLGRENKEPVMSPEINLCTECGERPWNPKYSKIKKCGVCVAKNRRGRRKPAPKPEPAVTPSPIEPGAAPAPPPAPRTNGRPVTLTTIHSDDMGGDTVATIGKAHELVEQLKGMGIPVMVEVAVRIIPEEGRAQ